MSAGKNRIRRVLWSLNGVDQSCLLTVPTLSLLVIQLVTLALNSIFEQVQKTLSIVLAKINALFTILFCQIILQKGSQGKYDILL